MRYFRPNDQPMDQPNEQTKGKRKQKQNMTKMYIDYNICYNNVLEGGSHLNRGVVYCMCIFTVHTVQQKKNVIL